MLIFVPARYADLAKAYRQIQLENQKVKEVMQQTQDKALRYFYIFCSLVQFFASHFWKTFEN
jgi:hypothetical protein